MNEDKSIIWLHSIYLHQKREDVQYYEMGGVRVERTQYRIWGGDEGEVGKLEVPPPFTFLSCTVEGEVECKPGRRSLGGLEERGGRGLFFEGHHLE